MTQVIHSYTSILYLSMSGYNSIPTCEAKAVTPPPPLPPKVDGDEDMPPPPIPRKTEQ